MFFDNSPIFRLSGSVTPVARFEAASLRSGWARGQEQWLAHSQPPTFHWVAGASSSSARRSRFVRSHTPRSSSCSTPSTTPGPSRTTPSLNPAAELLTPATRIADRASGLRALGVESAHGHAFTAQRNCHRRRRGVSSRPSRGARRRALLRDKAIRAGRITGDAFETTTATSQIARGALRPRRKGWIADRAVDDARLLERVRARPRARFVASAVR